MGDLKKKPVDLMIEDDEEQFFVECMTTKAEEQTVKRLQTYIRKFYEKQIEKHGQEGEKDGQIQDIQERDNGTPV